MISINTDTLSLHNVYSSFLSNELGLTRKFMTTNICCFFRYKKRAIVIVSSQITVLVPARCKLKQIFYLTFISSTYYRYDGGNNIIGYYDCFPDSETCPVFSLLNNAKNVNDDDEIDLEGLPAISNKIFALNFSTTQSK